MIDLYKLYNDALTWADVGCSVIRVSSDGTKAPVGLWKKYQSERAGESQFKYWYDNDDPQEPDYGIGVVCGEISGQLEMFEAEGRAVTAGIIPRLINALIEDGQADLWATISTGYVELSPGGGFHWYFRVDGPARHNTKLARRPATEAELAEDPKDKIKVLIETRGEGGFVVVAPTPGAYHETGRPWKAIVGSPATIPTITVEQRDALYAISTLFDEMPTPVQQSFSEPTSSSAKLSGGQRPGDDYNQRGQWSDILQGWTRVRRLGSGWAWRRPGKNQGISATTGQRDDKDRLYVFSTSTDFEAERPYDKFGAYALLHHGGDISAAGKALRRLGYGDKTPPKPPITTNGHSATHLGGGSLFDTATGKSPAAPETNGEARTGRRETRVTWADTIEPAPAVWAWEEDGSKRIPAGSLVTCAGREGTGKSSFGIWLAARITRGMLPGSFFGTPKKVLYAAMEDSWRYTLVPRLIAAGADLSRIGRIDVVTEENALGALSLPSDGVGLETAIATNDVALLVVDPLMSVMSETIDTYKAHDVRSALEPLVAMADRTGAIICGIAHFNKNKGYDVASLITGSGAFKDVPRAVFGFAKSDDGDRVMSQVKNSLGIDELPSLGYRIDQAVVETPTGPAETGRFVLTGESDRSVMDILKGGEEGGRRDGDPVGNWIKEYLRSRGGSAYAHEVYTAGEEQGFTSEAMKKARYRARNPSVESKKTGFGGGWVWSIVTQGAKVPDGPPSVPLGTDPMAKVPEAVGEPSAVHLGTFAAPQSFEQTHEGGEGGQVYGTTREAGTLGSKWANAKVDNRRGTQEFMHCQVCGTLTVCDDDRICPVSDSTHNAARLHFSALRAGQP